jgi:hypothetical protein
LTSLFDLTLAQPYLLCCWMSANLRLCSLHQKVSGSSANKAGPDAACSALLRHEGKQARLFHYAMRCAVSLVIAALINFSDFKQRKEQRCK